ncbi:hypothetical protein GCM10020331_083780 [Ectobacillus funiculus]
MLEETIDEVTEWERQTAAKMEEEQYLQLKQQEDLSIYELSPKEKDGVEEYLSFYIPMVYKQN